MQLKLATAAIAIVLAGPAAAGGGAGGPASTGAGGGASRAAAGVSGGGRVAAPVHAMGNRTIVKGTPARPDGPAVHRGLCESAAESERLCTRPTVGPRG